MTDALQFLPLDDSPVRRWNRPKRFDFLHRLPTAPIADTELLHMSHYCPIIVVLRDDGPRVAVLLDPALVKSCPVAPNGRWCAPYAPIALRNLPFWPGKNFQDIEIAPELAEAVDGGYELRDSGGALTEQFAGVVTWNDRLQQGIHRLGEAAKVVASTDLLTPLVVNQSYQHRALSTQYFTVDPIRFHLLSAVQAASLSVNMCLPLDLIAACLFSQKLLAPGIRLGNRDTPGAADVIGKAADFAELLDIDIKLDASNLFSFEDFELTHRKDTDTHVEA